MDSLITCCICSVVLVRLHSGSLVEEGTGRVGATGI